MGVISQLKIARELAKISSLEEKLAKTQIKIAKINKPYDILISKLKKQIATLKAKHAKILK